MYSYCKAKQKSSEKVRHKTRVIFEWYFLQMSYFFPDLRWNYLVWWISWYIPTTLKSANYKWKVVSFPITNCNADVVYTYTLMEWTTYDGMIAIANINVSTCLFDCSVSHTTDDLVFQWDPTTPLVVENVELPQQQLVKNNTADCTQVYSTGKFSICNWAFKKYRRNKQMNECMMN